MITVHLKPEKEQSIERMHPWIFSGAIANISQTAQEGDIVDVYSSKNIFLGRGHYANGSIAIRILSFEKVCIDVDFFTDRIRKALSLRYNAGLITPYNNIFRLIHGEGDFLPGLIVDVYGSTAVIQAHSIGMHLQKNEIAKAITLISQEPDSPINISSIFYKSEGTLPKIDLLNVENGFIFGEPKEEVIQENGIRIIPDWIKGQKTGFFIDQRDNRALVEKYSRDKTVLNTFCYTGGFSLYALRGGAKKVDSLDSSAKAMYLTEEHVKDNFSEDIVAKHNCIVQDAFDYLNNLEANKYDMIILDPPAFAKHRKVLRNALVGYRKINTQAIKNIASGGILFTFSCSQAVSVQEFRLTVFSSAAATGRRVRIIHQLTQPTDHPINIYHPEGEYLKGLVLQVD